eukprot:7498098-Pyramimonas_sp.AAC.1
MLPRGAWTLAAASRVRATLAIHAASGVCLGARGSWIPLRRTFLVEDPCALPTYLALCSSSWH